MKKNKKIQARDIKKFVGNIRHLLEKGVKERLDFILKYKEQSPELIEKKSFIQSIERDIYKHVHEHLSEKEKQKRIETEKHRLIEEIASNWFNRLVCLRYMDVNNYQPLKINVVSPANESNKINTPEILNRAKKDFLPKKLLKQKQHEKIKDILSGRLQSRIPEKEIYEILLLASCDALNRYFPILFEPISKEKQLLLPSNIFSHDLKESIIHQMNLVLNEENAKQNLEIIHRVYFFYNEQKKKDIINKKKKYARDDLSSVSQLFTPKWIIQYLVDNTLGQYWLEQDPQSNLRSLLPYYVSPSQNNLRENKKAIEEITFFEPCAGSGHILSYAYDVFYHIYQEEGYNPREIPFYILKNNLYGTDIDKRAIQLTSFVLTIKGREKDRRFFDSAHFKVINNLVPNILPNITFYEDFPDNKHFEDAQSYGSLIKTEGIKSYTIHEGTVFAQRQKKLDVLYRLLGSIYDIVVTHPPYINRNKMNEVFKKHIEKEYPIEKYDLFACFISQCLVLCAKDGLTGFLTPNNWTNIKSFERLRWYIINYNIIENFVELGAKGLQDFNGLSTAFILRNKSPENELGNYIQLINVEDTEFYQKTFSETIKTKDKKHFYQVDQNNFRQLPNNIIGYDIKPKILHLLKNKNRLQKYTFIKIGFQTGNDALFTRQWHEVNFHDIDLSFNEHKNGMNQPWIPFSNSLGFRKWYGHQEFVVYWKNNGENIKNHKGSILRNITSQLRESGTFSSRPNSISVRYNEAGSFFQSRNLFFLSEKNQYFHSIIAFLNSIVAEEIIELICSNSYLNPTKIEQIPFLIIEDIYIQDLIELSKEDWNQRETSWDFKKNELLRFHQSKVEDAYTDYTQYWEKQFLTLHRREEEINQQCIDNYGLKDELSPNVSYKKVTILTEEIDEDAIKENNLVFDKKSICEQLVSYAVGCMFGRYSLEKDGLILANQGENIKDFLRKIGKAENQVSFMPDDDGILPIVDVVDGIYFEDDIVSKFEVFIRVAFGEQYLMDNLTFIEDGLGKRIRSYFLDDFYQSHVKRYNYKPIYWLFSSTQRTSLHSSQKGSFNVLVYMHSYNQDTLYKILHDYLNKHIKLLQFHVEKIDKELSKRLATRKEKSINERNRNKIIATLKEVDMYRKNIEHFARQKISLDLNAGVLVNYNKFFDDKIGNILFPVDALNKLLKQKKAKELEKIWDGYKEEDEEEF
ncbi:MAG: BREX-1 system adenine-specific DNA-methyltransferase PglX [Flavobacteriaceae bacterium]|nr:BREX-1 system adenine-specific DNA-methyltransferase PglX [Flavobacteriaceae bacterium]